jgi:hypothetical protein
MEGRENPHVDKYKEITNNWNYDAGCTLTALPVSTSENFKRLILLHRVYTLPSDTAEYGISGVLKP